MDFLLVFLILGSVTLAAYQWGRNAGIKKAIDIMEGDENGHI